MKIWFSFHIVAFLKTWKFIFEIFIETCQSFYPNFYFFIWETLQDFIISLSLLKKILDAVCFKNFKISYLKIDRADRFRTFAVKI